MGVLLSILLYGFGLLAAVAALALIRPISWLGLRTRRRAFVAWQRQEPRIPPGPYDLYYELEPLP